MSRVRLSRSKATAQAIFVFAVTVSLYAALLVLHTELSGEQSSIPMQLNVVTQRSSVAFGGGSRTYEVGDNSKHAIDIGSVHQPPEVSQESQGELSAKAQSSDDSKLRGTPGVSPVAAQAGSTPSPALQITKLETEKQNATFQVLPQVPLKAKPTKTEAAETGAAVHDSTLKPSRSIIRYHKSWQTELLLSKLLHTSGPCAKHVPAGEDAVLVRMCCELTDAKIESIQRYSKQVRDVDLWVLYDFRAAGEPEILRVEERFRKLQVDHAFSVFMYNSKLAERLYPGSHEKLESISSQVNLAIHEVSVAAWWRTCAKHKWGDEVSGNAKSPRSLPLPKHVWSIESDAAFSGDVMPFLGYYRTYNEHLVVGWEDKAKEEWIVEKYKQMPEMSVLPHDVIYGKPNALTRMSSRFLYHLDAALRANFILHGEMYISTLCRGVFADWCTVRPLIDGPFYSPEPGGFISPHLLSEEEWEKANTDAGLRNRWYHPVASLKDPTTAVE